MFKSLKFHSLSESNRIADKLSHKTHCVSCYVSNILLPPLLQIQNQSRAKYEACPCHEVRDATVEMNFVAAELFLRKKIPPVPFFVLTKDKRRTSHLPDIDHYSKRVTFSR